VVPDAHRALDELANRGGPRIALDDTTSDKVLFATVEDADGNAITLVEVRAGAAL
jgi:hypothetical protein